MCGEEKITKISYNSFPKSKCIDCQKSIADNYDKCYTCKFSSLCFNCEKYIDGKYKK